MLCCPSHPTFLAVCHLVVPERGLKYVVTRQAFGPDHTHSSTNTESTSAEKENHCWEICTNSCLCDWATVSATRPANGFFCVYLYSDTKGQLKCVRAWSDYSIPSLFLLHSHANPGLLTLQSSEITQAHRETQVTTHREHGKVSDHFQKGGVV